MKANGRLSCKAEKEALEWATEFFRNCKDDLKADGSRRADKRFALETLMQFWDGSDAVAAKLVDALQRSPRLPEFAAALIERGEPLPGPLRDFVAAYLREPNKWLKRHRGRKPRGIAVRDMTIAAAVGFIAGKWKFAESRRRDQRSGFPCAASIVKEALATGASVHLSEDKIIKAFGRFVCNIKSHDGYLIIGKGQLLIGRTEVVRELASDDLP